MPHRIDDIAAAMAMDQDMVADILATHVRDDRGRCVACALEPWPCRPRGYAALARRRNVNDRGLP